MSLFQILFYFKTDWSQLQPMQHMELHNSMFLFLSLFNSSNSSSLFDTKYWELMFLDSFYDDFKDFAWVTTAIPIFSLPKSHTVSANLATVARFSVSLYCVHLWTHAI